MLRNTKTSYGSVAKFFHWSIAALIIFMLIGGACFGLIPKGPTKSLIMQIHKSIGVSILFLMIVRFIWKLSNPVPTLPSTLKNKRLETGLSHLMHLLLYITVIAMPLSGIVMSLAKGYNVSFWWLFNVRIPGVPVDHALSEYMRQTHVVLAWTITVLIVLHILAALKHHFLYKNDVLKRMF